jgi:hypothetical protein
MWPRQPRPDGTQALPSGTADPQPAAAPAEPPRSALRPSRRALIKSTALLFAACKSGGRARPDAASDGGADAAGDAGAGDVAGDAGGPLAAFAAWREMREAVRRSPDHLPAEAARVVAGKDPEAIFKFVRDRIATMPASADDLGGADRTLWGERGTLRGGMGTLRDKAELLVALYRRAGFEANVVEGPAADGPAAVGRILRDARRVGPPPFQPGAVAADLARWRTVVGPASGTRTGRPIPGPTDAEVRALAERVLAALPADAAATATLSLTPSAAPIVPLVAVTVGGAVRHANPAYADLAFGTSGVTGEPTPAPPVRPPGKARFSLGVVTTTSGRDPIELAALELDTQELVGRSLYAAFVPPVDATAFKGTRRDEVRVFAPALFLRGPDLDQAEHARLTAVGKALTLDGDTVEVKSESDVTLGGQAIDLGETPPDRLAAVARLEVSADASRFPVVELRVAALDAQGASVPGLTGRAFSMGEDGKPVAGMLVANRPRPPRVLFLLDRSDSLPADFRGEAVGALVRGIATRVRAEAPGAEFRVFSVGGGVDEGAWVSDPEAVGRAAVSQPGTGSDLWAALASAAEIAPTVFVFVTDGEAEFAPSEGDIAKLVDLAPGVLVAVGTTTDVARTTLARMARLTGGEVVTGPDATRAADEVVPRLLREARSPYRLRYRAPADGNPRREVTVTLTGRPPSGRALYDVLAGPERRPARRLVGLLLTVTLPGERAVTRVLAGLRAPVPDMPATLFDDVEAALLGATELRFEGAAPTLAVQLEESLAYKLALEPLANAQRARDAGATLEAYLKRPVPRAVVPRALLTRLSTDGEYPIFPGGLRAAAFTSAPRANGTLRHSSDLLPVGAHHTPAATARASLESTATATARLSLWEKAIFKRSAAAVLASGTLVALPSRDPATAFPALTPAQRARWALALEDYSEDWVVVPEGGHPLALMAVDRATGALLAVGQTGGGDGETDCLMGLLDLADFLSSLAALGGALGTTGAVWLDLQLTLMRKLLGATVVIAGGRTGGGSPTDFSDLPEPISDAILGQLIERLAASGIPYVDAVAMAVMLVMMAQDIADLIDMGLNLPGSC